MTSRSHLSAESRDCTLQSFVAPVAILAASICTASTSFCSSTQQLSQMTSAYSRSLIKQMYIFSREGRQRTNVRERSNPILVHALLTMDEICIFHFASSEKERPICVWDFTVTMGVSSISIGGCFWRISWTLYWKDWK